MSEEDHASRRDPRERTVKTAGRIVKYSREIYHLESVESYGGAVAVADSEHGGADFRITLKRP